MQEKGCVSPALVISIMETQHFTAFSLYAAEVNYERFLKFCFHFSTWNANSRLGNVNSTFSLSHKEGAELKKQHKVESWEVELHTHSDCHQHVCWPEQWFSRLWNSERVRGKARTFKPSCWLQEQLLKEIKRKVRPQKEHKTLCSNSNQLKESLYKNNHFISDS